MMPNPNHLTVDEVAARTRLKRKTVLAALRREQLRGYKVGKEWRITPEALDEYCAEYHAPIPPPRKKRQRPGAANERHQRAVKSLAESIL